MRKLYSAARFITVISSLILVSFATGWLAYEFSYAKSRSIPVSASAPWVKPPGLQPIFLPSTAQNKTFVAGDRLDVLVTVDDEEVTLILDAFVTNNSTSNLQLLIDRNAFGYFHYARSLDLEFQFRPSVVPEQPGYAPTYLQAETDYDQPLKP